MNVDACAGQQVLENALAVACVRTLLFSKVLLFFSAFILEGQFRRIFTGYSSFFCCCFCTFAEHPKGRFVLTAFFTGISSFLLL